MIIIQDIEKVFWGFKDKKAHNINEVFAVLKSMGVIGYMSDEDLRTDISRKMYAESKKKGPKILKKAKNPKTNRPGRGWYMYVDKTVKNPDPLPKPFKPLDTLSTDTKFIGTGGEYEVMSKLFFNGYFACPMIVDKGVDCTAMKNGNVFYIQVKTTNLEENMSCSVSVDKLSLARVEPLNVVYVIVMRCLDRNRFFKFNQDQIKAFADSNYISASGNKYNLKIKYNQQNYPVLYNGQKSVDITEWKNFEL